MKKTNSSFTVEYKSGRRKAERKPTSIWGDLDLKSVALRELGETASFAFPQEAKEMTSNGSHSDGQNSPAAPVLTPTPPQQNNGPAIEEIQMADENETITEENTPAPTETVAPSPVKQRKPRAKKVAVDTIPAQGEGAPSGVNAIAGQQKRGRKVKSVPVASVVKSKRVYRTSTPVESANATPSAAIDEMADLLKLEEENRSLRKQLSEKLRAENADLRKRLNLD